MTTETQLHLTELPGVGLENLRKRWGWFLALDMLLNGWSLVMLGLAAKKLPGPSLPP